MAIYHCSAKIISRSTGRSSVAAAAYRAGEKLTNERDGVTHDYTRKSGIAHTEIILPDSAPEEYQGRHTLWNAVEKSENRKDAQTAREIEVALPSELNLDEQKELLRGYIKENFTDHGMITDYAIHNKKGNPHAHILLTTRKVTKDGFGKKERSWNRTELLEQWRASWAAAVNRGLEKRGFEARIDHRTLQAQGIEREPTIHMGAAAHQMERRGIKSERGTINMEIQQRNTAYVQDLAELESMLTNLRQTQQVAAPSVTTWAPAEQMAIRMAELRNEYISLELRQTAPDPRKEKIASVARVMEYMDESGQNLKRIDAQLGQLRLERDALGAFRGKERKEYTIKIERLEESRDRAIHAFRQDFKVDPSQFQSALAHLQGMINELMDDSQPLAEHTAQVAAKASMAVIMSAFKELKILADIHPERDKIYSLMKRHHSATSPLASLSERMMAAKAETRLNNITTSEYKELLPKLAPDKAKMVLDMLSGSAARTATVMANALVR